MSLRSRLVIGSVAVLLIGMLATGVVTMIVLRQVLVSGLDERLASISAAVSSDLADGALDEDVAARYGPTVIQVRSADGTTVVHNLSTKGVVVPRSRLELDGSGRASYGMGRSAGAGTGDAMSLWRLRISRTSDGQELLVGLPLGDFNQAFGRLVRAESVIIGVLSLIMMVIAARLIRNGLLPLERIAQDAAAVGNGDLDRRIEAGASGTEIGRLSEALNRMLRRLSDAFDEQRRSEQRLRDFVADASHELNTPIATIRGYAELFRHGAADDPEQLRMSMSRIESEAGRMGVLVDELLELARLDDGPELERSPVRLDRLAAELVENARTVDPGRPMRLTVKDTSVHGDEALLRRLLSNLLANVSRHTPAGAPAAVRVTHHDRSTVIEVADSGPGIPAEARERIFERFYRPRRDRARGGSGLGLAIVDAIATAHGGTATVLPYGIDRGHGATFVITLPDPGAGTATPPPPAPQQ